MTTMPNTFFCGVDRETIHALRTRITGPSFVLQVGQRAGNIALAAQSGRSERSPLSPMARDLVEIGAYLHQSDRLVPRDLDAWSRSLDYHLAVSDLERWSGLAPLLGRIASFISGDRIRVYLHPRRHGPTWTAEIPTPATAASSVMLYSGGLDSSSGVSELLAQGARTVAVTQYSNRLADRASLLVDIAGAGGGEVPLVAFHVMPRRARALPIDGGPPLSPLCDRESTWRLRTFLYLALAGAVADSLGIERILMFENGILAHNLPFDPYVIGARSTRHAHPTFLLLMEELFAKLFDRRISIRNPFQFLTKGGEAGPLAALTMSEPGTRSLVARTNSCWYFPNFVARLSYAGGQPVSHCGACMPCKIRRLAVLEAGLDRWEPIAGQYFIDPLTANGFSGAVAAAKFAHVQHARNLGRLRSYVTRITQCDQLQTFAAEWPQVFEFEGKNLSLKTVASVPGQIFSMYQDFARHAITVL